MVIICIFARVKAWSHAVGVARKHVSNWQSLVLKAVSGSDGVFRSRAGGTISCDAKMLLRQLVRLENAWNHYGDVLKPVGFEDEDVIVPDYFGRDFRIPLKAVGVAPPSAFLKYYPFDVAGETVLDIGAYLGDTPLMWLYRGAKSVVAVEPEPLSFKYLEGNVKGLPVTCLNASLVIQVPKTPNKEGSTMAWWMRLVMICLMFHQSSSRSLLSSMGPVL